MKNYFEKISIFIMIAIVFLTPKIVFGAITLNPDYQGAVVITAPDQSIVSLDEGNAIPEILNQSKIELSEGEMTLQTEEGDEVSVGCSGGGSGTAGGSSAVEVSCQGKKGKITVLRGSFTFKDADGTEKVYETGDVLEFSILLGDGGIADETAAGSEPGTPLDLDSSQPSVDARSIQASQSQ